MTTYNGIVRDALWGQSPTKWVLFGIVTQGEHLIRASQNYWGDSASSEPKHQRLVSKVCRGYEQVLDRVERAEKAEAYLAQMADAARAASPVDPPGPKPGAEAASRTMWEIALTILNDPARAPAIKHGWRSAIAREVEVEAKTQGLHYDADSIAKMLRPSLTEWERKNVPIKS